MKKNIGLDEAVGIKHNIIFITIFCEAAMLWLFVNEMFQIVPHSIKLIHDLSYAYMGVGIVLVGCVLIIYYDVNRKEKLIRNCLFQAVALASLILITGIAAHFI